MLRRNLHMLDIFSIFVLENQTYKNGDIAAYHKAKI